VLGAPEAPGAFSASFPTSCPYVTAVGGTQLPAAGNVLQYSRAKTNVSRGLSGLQLAEEGTEDGNAGSHHWTSARTPAMPRYKNRQAGDSTIEAGSFYIPAV